MPIGFSMRRNLVPMWPVILLAVFALTVQLAPEQVGRSLRYERDAVLAGEWWRAFGAHVVHLGWTHLLMNLLALAIIAAAVPTSGVGRHLRFGLLLLWLMLAVTFGLLVVDADVDWYVGLSGVLHGLLVFGALAEWRQQRRFAVLLLAGVAVKLVWEQADGALGTEALIGAPVVVSAHLYGAVAGTMAGLFELRLTRVSSSRPVAGRC